MSLVARSRRTKRWRLPRAAATAVHLVLALAFVFGLMQSGGRYFYCEAVGLLPYDPCVDTCSQQDHRPSAVETLTETRTDCCKVVTLEAMPQAAQAAAPSIPPAHCVAVLPAIPWTAGAESSPSVGRSRALARWGPPPKAADDARARLMVFLI